jgi:hypothetical protein
MTPFFPTVIVEISQAHALTISSALFFSGPSIVQDKNLLLKLKENFKRGAIACISEMQNWTKLIPTISTLQTWKETCKRG